jgi:hypothetical protein
MMFLFPWQIVLDLLERDIRLAHWLLLLDFVMKFTEWELHAGSEQSLGTAFDFLPEVLNLVDGQ